MPLQNLVIQGEFTVHTDEYEYFRKIREDIHEIILTSYTLILYIFTSLKFSAD